MWKFDDLVNLTEDWKGVDELLLLVEAKCNLCNKSTCSSPTSWDLRRWRCTVGVTNTVRRGTAECLLTLDSEPLEFLRLLCEYDILSCSVDLVRLGEVVAPQMSVVWCLVCVTSNLWELKGDSWSVNGIGAIEWQWHVVESELEAGCGNVWLDEQKLWVDKYDDSYEMELTEEVLWNGSVVIPEDMDNDWTLLEVKCPEVGLSSSKFDLFSGTTQSVNSASSSGAGTTWTSEILVLKYCELQLI